MCATPKVYVRDGNPGAYAVKVQCIDCGTMRLLAEMLIDRDGPAFRAYYCPACLPVAVIRWPNNDSPRAWEVRRNQRDGSFLPMREVAV